MFNAPCCFTCTHVVGDALQEEACCAFHGKQLPAWLPQWKSELPVCNRWRHYNAADAAEPLHAAFPDPAVLYAYPNEYSTHKTVLARFAALPDA
jgi:hypothetical protein